MLTQCEREHSSKIHTSIFIVSEYSYIAKRQQKKIRVSRNIIADRFTSRTKKNFYFIFFCSLQHISNSLLLFPIIIEIKLHFCVGKWQNRKLIFKRFFSLNNQLYSIEHFNTYHLHTGWEFFSCLVRSGIFVAHKTCVPNEI